MCAAKWPATKFAIALGGIVCRQTLNTLLWSYWISEPWLDDALVAPDIGASSTMPQTVVLALVSRVTPLNLPRKPVPGSCSPQILELLPVLPSFVCRILGPDFFPQCVHQVLGSYHDE